MKIVIVGAAMNITLYIFDFLSVECKKAVNWPNGRGSVGDFVEAGGGTLACVDEFKISLQKKYFTMTAFFIQVGFA